MTDTNEIHIDEYPLKVLKLGNSMSNHFKIYIIPSENKGKISFLNRNELEEYTYEFGKEGIIEIKKFLEMIK
jgi:hypothetical protein